ncbi:Uncharacterized protein YPO0396 [Caldanaerovirga acetigignens]|uniref:Uncharacterized protein YPO0396 n=1 Tax=Caldanaerovirga acetigignens TaxID=447595 RepID=A0A1M7MFB6_9FIRM|nr:SbcC/MukB-like Walker B domain-containing protein [Caldanaerovirga acetigignens]SHM89526.1 Uncharacterized protein YPO0396 [Caldanaerovirga acetigignens]
MKLLKKLLLINWHYILHELIEFEMINFLTGKNGAGKSTIVDALQLLILGDTKGDYFNKAANERSKRNLKGYLRGDIADDTEGGILVLREGNFSSYIVGEFYDTAKKGTFCYGVAFDVYENGDENHRFFYLESYLPENHFIVDGVPLNTKDLRTFLNARYRERFKIFNSNREYQAHFLARMGSLNEKFYSVFKKSVSFSPIVEIEKFITEYVCDAPPKIDISDMQENLRYYKELEYQAQQVKKMVGDLEEIQALYNEYLAEERKLKEQEYLIKRAQVESVINQRRALIEEAQIKKALLEEKEGQKNEFERKVLELERRKDDLIREKYSMEDYKKSEYLKAQEESMREQIKEKKVALQQFLGNYTKVLQNWEIVLEEICAFPDKFDEKFLKTTKEKIKKLRAVTAEDITDIEEEKLLSLKNAAFQCKDRIEKLFYSMEQEKTKLEEDIRKIESEIENLKKGIKPYDRKLLELKSEIEKALKSKYKKEIKVEILADLLEVRDKKWQNAIEAYLHTQKFYLVPEPEYFVDALKIYDRLKFEKGFYDIGLVDTGKLEKQNIKVWENSLASEVMTDNRYARLFVDFLLGRVAKCEKVEELRNYPTAITPDCMLYQNYVARQLNPERWRFPYIGKKSLEDMLKAKTAEVKEKRILLDELMDGYERLARIKNVEPITESFMENLKNAKKEKEKLDILFKKLEEIERQKSLLDLTKLMEIDDRIAKAEKELEGAKNEIKRLQGVISEITSEIRLLEHQKEQKEKELKSQLLALEERFDLDFIKDTGEPRFLKELQARKDPENIIKAFQSQLARTQSQKEKKWNLLLNKRSDYNREYKMPFNVSSGDNSEYRKELERLLRTELPAYEEKIRDAKEKARIQFQEDFISKIKENIDKVKEQIEELNSALKQFSFGKDRYRFEVRPNPAYRKFYDMIMDSLLLEGYSIFSIEFQKRHGEALEELFNQIVYVGESTLSADEREKLEKNIETYTDYRTYLTFDLIVTDDQGRESRLSRMLLKKSGGETQTPFYISILASFGRIYRLGHKYGENNTLRLIIFDEAFSKMDHQRVQESIKLLRSFGFQAIISAPTEKIQDIATLVDRNLCVIKGKDSTIVRAFDPREVMEEGEGS